MILTAAALAGSYFYINRTVDISIHEVCCPSKEATVHENVTYMWSTFTKHIQILYYQDPFYNSHFCVHSSSNCLRAITSFLKWLNLQNSQPLKKHNFLKLNDNNCFTSLICPPLRHSIPPIPDIHLKSAPEKSTLETDLPAFPHGHLGGEPAAQSGRRRRQEGRRVAWCGKLRTCLPAKDAGCAACGQRSSVPAAPAAHPVTSGGNETSNIRTTAETSRRLRESIYGLSQPLGYHLEVNWHSHSLSRDVWQKQKVQH